MARVEVFQGGRVQLQPGTDARQRAADFGPGIGSSIEAAGRGLGQVAEKLDEVEDVKATNEANIAAIEYAKAASAIKNKVSQSLGTNAEAAAAEGGAELDKLSSEVLGKVSPRARMKLQNEIGAKSVMYKDSFADHGFRQTVAAREESDTARITAIVEEAADIEDEEKAQVTLGSLAPVLEEHARFFGKGDDWVRQEQRKLASGFFKSRALRLTVGPNGSALAAIEYATKHRESLTDGDYNSIVSAYNDNALDEVADAEIYGANSLSATVAEEQATDQEGNPVAARRLDPKAFFDAFTVPHEGAAYVIDSNGHGAKYGINAQYNPGVDVKNLTKAQASKIFEERYWKRSGADKLPPALAAVHVDTFYLNEKEATRMLKESGGDPDKYIRLRHAFLNGLASRNPGKYGKYRKGWENRTNALKAFADRQGGDGVSNVPMAITDETDLTDFRARTMARTDIGGALKRKILARAEEQRSNLRQERSIAESAAADSLNETALSLGERFTDVKQLPQSAWLQASVATREALTSQAKSNRENKPASPDDLAYINFVKISDPKKFASRAFTDELIKKGVPMSTVRQVAQEQGAVAGQLISAKPDEISSGSLWTIAKPAFEAAGILLDTVEAKTDKDKAKERQADAAEQIRATNFLAEMHRNWSLANPGKKADEATIRQWVGYALRQTRHGRGYQLNDQQFYERIPPAERQAAARALIRVDPNWAKKPVSERIQDVVRFTRTRAATGL